MLLTLDDDGENVVMVASEEDNANIKDGSNQMTNHEPCSEINIDVGRW